MFRIEIKCDYDSVPNKVIYTNDERKMLHNICTIDFTEGIIFPEANMDNIKFELNKEYEIPHDNVIGAIVKIKIFNLDNDFIGRRNVNNRTNIFKMRANNNDIEKIEKYKEKHNLKSNAEVVRIALELLFKDEEI